MGRPSGGSWQPRDCAPAFNLSAYSGSALAAATRGWQQLCDNERDSVIAASLALTDLARLGAPPSILGRATRVIEDEVRHVEVCATVIRALGGEVSAPPAASTRASLGDGSLEQRCAVTLVAGFAAGEPLSAACFAAARSAACEPLVKWAYTELLRDEARHGAFGVVAGSWLVRSWDPTRRRALFPACVAEMEAFERAIGGVPAQGTANVSIDGCGAAQPAPAASEVEALGYLPRPAAHAAMLAAVPRWVLPSLEKIGVVGAEWH